MENIGYLQYHQLAEIVNKLKESICVEKIVKT